MHECEKCGKTFKTKGNKSNHIKFCTGKVKETKIYDIENIENLSGKEIAKIKLRLLWQDPLYREKQSKRTFKFNPLTEEGLNIKKEKCRAAINKRYAEGWEVRAGRCKKIKYSSVIAGEVLLDGTWELSTAKYFDENKIDWRRNKTRFSYIDYNGKNRTYCPDFYLVDSNKYIEVKGYKTELDECKWSQFQNSLEVWDKKILSDKKII